MIPDIPESNSLGARRRTVAVVGAGLSGLTAAYRLQQGGMKTCLFEALGNVGGRVQTVNRGGWLLDTGAAAITSSYSAYLELIQELGLDAEVVAASPYVGIFRDNEIHHLKLDSMIRSAITTRVVSLSAKLQLWRLIVDLVIAVRRGQLDYGDMRKAAPLDTETAEQYGLRALNREINDYLFDPIVRTMLIADACRISKVELFSGIANIFAARVCALKGGQARLPETLARVLDVRLRHEVTRISWAASRLNVEVRNQLGNVSTETVDACVVACPLAAAAQICPDPEGSLSRFAAGLDYTKAIAVAVGLRIRPKSPAFLVQMPAREDAEIALMFLDHNKAPDRAPPGRGLISCNWEAEASALWFERTDEDICKRTIATVERVFPDLKGQVEFWHVTRWKCALPYSRVGSYKLIGDFNASLDSASPMQFAADFMSAAGQNTAVAFGNKAAANLLAHGSGGSLAR